MGDHAYLSVSILGHINSVKTLNRVINAINIEGLIPDDDSQDIKNHFKRAAQKTCPEITFHDYECNYAEVDTLEAELQQLSVPYCIYHEEGGDYSAGCRSWSPEQGFASSVRVKHHDSVIDTHTLATALDAKDPIAELTQLLNQASRAEGAGLPKLTFSNQVIKYLMTDQPSQTNESTNTVNRQSA